MKSIKSLVKPSKKTDLSYISLFCGAGGLDIGFYQAGFIPKQSIDSNKDAIKTYQSLFRDHEVICGDVRSLSPVNKVQIVIGGPPCQGFSVAGYSDPDDPRSKHIISFMNIVKSVKPKVFVMENVKSLAISDKWENNRKKLKQLAKRMGYDAKFYVLNAADFGVPQKRERMFFIGVMGKNNLDLTPPKSSKYISVREVLSKLPQYGTQGNSGICTAKIVLAKNPIIRGNAYSGMLFNGKGRILNLDDASLTLPASMGGNHTPIIDQKALEQNTENWGELLFNKIASKKPVKKVPKYLRRLTVEEAAALQTFPKDMEFFGSQCSRFKQIGNAVPPKLSYFVAKRIREQIFTY